MSRSGWQQDAYPLAEQARAEVEVKVRALAEEATQRAYAQIAVDKCLTIQPIGLDRAAVPGHWREESEDAASVPVRDLLAALSDPAAPEAEPLADHPYVDPGDGRTECYLCGKFIHEVTHSCKGVPVTKAAEHRVRALIDAVRDDERKRAAPEAEGRAHADEQAIRAAADLAATIRAYLTDETDVTRPSFHATALAARIAREGGQS